MQITAKNLNEMASRYESARASIKRIREESEKTIGKVTRSVVLNGTTFGMGIVNGRWNSPDLLGVPIDLGLGLGAHVLGFVGIGGDIMHNLGDGATAAYFNTLGMGIGKKMQLEAQAAKGAAPAQALPPQL
jgi:hypothetical protein